MITPQSESVQALKRLLKKSKAVPERKGKAWIDHDTVQEVDKNGKPKPKISEWERGRRDAVACGAGRLNFVDEV